MFFLHFGSFYLLFHAILRNTKNGENKMAGNQTERKTLVVGNRTCNAGTMGNRTPRQRKSWLELRLRRAVFSCVCTVVRSTQDQEKHFDTLLWADSFHDPTSSEADKTSVLALLLDLSKEHVFEVSPPSFYTTGLNPPRPPPPGGNRRGRGRGGRLTASGMLSQSSLGFGGDSLAGMGGGSGGLGGMRDSDGSDGGNNPAEDVRESYSSQMALMDPERASSGGDAGDDNASQGSSSQGSSFQSQLSPVFGRGSTAVVTARGGGRVGVAGKQGDDQDTRESAEEHEHEDVVLEMSHVNKEPCMRALLLVIQTERRAFESGWLDSYDRSGGV